VREQVLAVDDLVRMPHEVLKQHELFKGQRDFRATLGYFVGGRIKLHVVHGQYINEYACWAAQKRLDTGDKFVEGERLHHIVVGAAA